MEPIRLRSHSVQGDCCSVFAFLKFSKTGNLTHRHVETQLPFDKVPQVISIYCIYKTLYKRGEPGTLLQLGLDEGARFHFHSGEDL